MLPAEKRASISLKSVKFRERERERERENLYITSCSRLSFAIGCKTDKTIRNMEVLPGVQKKTQKPDQSTNPV